MAERYKKLAPLEGPQWSEGSPVVIEKGALLRDGSRNQNLLQLRLRNTQDKPLKAVVLDVDMFDVTSHSLGRIHCSFLDLEAGKGASFGDDTPIWLDDQTARGFRFFVSSVVFSDGSTLGEGSEMESVGETVELAALGDLQDQFAREIALLNAKVVPQVLTTNYGPLWGCTCGAVNGTSEPACASCGLGYEQQLAIADPAYLETQAATYRDQQAELASHTAQVQKREARKKVWSFIAAGVLGVALLGGVWYAAMGRSVTYYVDAPSSSALVTYTSTFGRVVQGKVSTPWKQTVPMWKGSFISITADDAEKPRQAPALRVTVDDTEFYGLPNESEVFTSIYGTCP